MQMQACDNQRYRRCQTLAPFIARNLRTKRIVLAADRKPNSERANNGVLPRSNPTSGDNTIERAATMTVNTGQ